MPSLDPERLDRLKLAAAQVSRQADPVAGANRVPFFRSVADGSSLARRANRTSQSLRDFLADHAAQDLLEIFIFGGQVLA